MNVCFLAQDVGEVYGAERATVDLVAGLRAGPEPLNARVLMIEETRTPRDRSRYREVLEERGVPYTIVSTPRRFSLRLIRDITHHLRIHRVDVLHCVGVKANVHGWLAAGKVPTVAAVTTVHGWLARPGWKEKLYNKVDQLLLRHFQTVIVLSRHYDAWMRSLGVSADRLVHIPAGFDTGNWPVRAEARSASNRPFTVGTMARLSAEKNQALLLQAASRMQERGTALRLVLAGNGPDRSRLERAIEQAGLADVVTLAGYMKPERFCWEVDVVALCSRLENLPYSIMEAMASGLPCVVTRAGGLAELVDDGVTGFVVEPDHVDDLVDRLSRLSADRDLARRLGGAGREKLIREFSVEEQVAVHKRMYASLAIR